MEGKVKSLYTNANKHGIGDQILIILDDDRILLIETFWGEYLDEKAFDKIKNKFSESKRFRNKELHSIHVIEGVATYLLFEDNVILHLYEELEDLERMAFYNRIEIIEKVKDLELYKELLGDIKELAEIMID